MENMILIRVDTEADLTDLDASKNMLILVEETGVLYRGNESGTPVMIMDDNGVNYATHFLLMGG